MNKVLKFVLAIILIITMITMNKTYSYYVDEYSNDVNFNIASWKINVNNQDITDSTIKNFTIDQFDYKKSPTSTLTQANSKFAPGMIAEFILEIDANKVDVSFISNLEIDMSNVGNDNIIVSYIKSDEENFTYEDGLYQYIYDIKEDDKTKTITVGIEWLETEEKETYNTSEKLNIPIKISFKQKTE